jgi:hypothetical protein
MSTPEQTVHIPRASVSSRRLQRAWLGRHGALLPPAAALVVVLSVVLGALLFNQGTAGAQAPLADWRVTGEHGLWVRIEDRSVTVHWITEEPGRGVLEAYAGDRRIAHRRTRAGVAHRASFRARGAEEVLLRYGSLDDVHDRHETRVVLRQPDRPPVAVTGVDTLFVLGDTHGEYDAVVEGLQAAGLVDGALRWTGGRNHVAFAGDLTDRGPDVLGLLWLVYRLEREAAAAGGAVHVVLGNHEIMVLLGDLRYVHPKELQIAELHGVSYQRLLDVRESVLGRWLASRPGLVRVDRVLIAHGGLGDLYAGYGLQEFDDSLSSYVAEELFARWADTTWVVPMDSATFQRRDDFFWHPDSAFWHRDYVQTDTADAVLDRVLTSMESDLLVVGHTSVVAVAAGYDGRLIAAHTPGYGAELLLLVRGPDGYQRYRVSAAGRHRF